jgi:hypothetical protein
MSSDTESLAATSRPKVLPFSIPDWVPSSVVEEALTIWFRSREQWQPEQFYDILYAQSYLPHFRELIRQLVTDDRMQRVWTELSKRHRKASRQFVHPARGLTQSEAWATLFRRALMKRLFDVPVVTETEMKSIAEQRRQIVPNLRKLADDLARGGGPPRYFEEMHRLAERIELWAESGEDDGITEGPLLVERQRGDPLLRSYARQMSRACEELFGKRLYGVVAKITSVAFRRDITGEEIRAHVRDAKGGV